MNDLVWLDDELEFPPIEWALDEPEGLLAAGGDLSPERLLLAYRQGIFPWYETGQPILWWSPSPRWVLKPDDFHLSRSLRKLIQKDRFYVTFDQAFGEVIRHCAKPRRQAGGTWITAEMEKAYITLHEMGHCHSVEVWETLLPEADAQRGDCCECGQHQSAAGQQTVLRGGLYGVAIGKAFFGESMFSNVANGSKIALAFLARQLRHWGFGFIDCQMHTQHLQSLGARPLNQLEFKRLLQQHTIKQQQQPWQLTITSSEFVN